MTDAKPDLARRLIKGGGLKDGSSMGSFAMAGNGKTTNGKDRVRGSVRREPGVWEPGVVVYFRSSILFMRILRSAPVVFHVAKPNGKQGSTSQ